MTTRSRPRTRIQDNTSVVHPHQTRPYIFGELDSPSLGPSPRWLVVLTLIVFSIGFATLLILTCQ